MDNNRDEPLLGPEEDFPEKDRIQRLERLLEISRTLNSTFELEPFLQTIIAAAAEMTCCETASILELVEGGEQLHFLALPRAQREKLKEIRVPLQSSVAGWVLLNAQAAVIPDVRLEPRHFKGADQVANITTHSLMVVPISFQGETLAVLEVINKIEPAHYTEEDLIILETLASQAAIAIQISRLVSKVQVSHDQVSQLDRMKSNFIAIASHELRTPLGLILGHATFLREVIQSEYQPQMDIIMSNTMRLKEIIDSIATMDNVQRGMASLHTHPVSIKHVVEEVMDSLLEQAKLKQISMRLEAGVEDLLVEADPDKLAIALSNLVNNAITFTDPGGHVVIRAGSIPGYARVSVIDDGIGIPSGDLPRIFERFYQIESHLTRKHGGMGLGLSVAKVMVELHGGRIWAESIEGKGSNFTFLIPIIPSHAGAASPVFIS